MPTTQIGRFASLTDLMSEMANHQNGLFIVKDRGNIYEFCSMSDFVSKLNAVDSADIAFIKYFQFNSADELKNHISNEVAQNPHNHTNMAALNSIIDTDLTEWSNKQDNLGYTPLDKSTKDHADGYVSLDSSGKVSIGSIKDEYIKAPITLFTVDTKQEMLDLTNDQIKPFDVVWVKDNDPGASGDQACAYICTKSEPGDVQYTTFMIFTVEGAQSLDWSNIADKPLSSIIDIDDTVDKAHNHTNLEDILKKFSLDGEVLKFDTKSIVYGENGKSRIIGQYDQRADPINDDPTSSIVLDAPFIKNDTKLWRFGYKDLKLARGKDYTFDEANGTVNLLNGVTINGNETVHVTFYKTTDINAAPQATDFIGICMASDPAKVENWKYIDKDGNFITLADENSFFDTHNLFKSEEVTIGEDIFVKFNAGYVDTWIGDPGTDSAGMFCIGVASRPFRNAKLHPAFYNYNTGQKILRFYMGKYEASTKTIPSGTKLCSVGGYTMPATNKTKQEFLDCIDVTNAETPNVNGYHMMNFYENRWLNLLVLIRFCRHRIHTDVGPGSEVLRIVVNNGAVALKVYSIWGNVYEILDGIQFNPDLGNNTIQLLKPGAINTYVDAFQPINANHVNVHKIEMGSMGSAFGNRNIGIFMLPDRTTSNGTTNNYMYRGYNSINSANCSFLASGSHTCVGNQTVLAGPFFLMGQHGLDYKSAEIGTRLCKYDNI